ncbi:MAG: signal peptidase I [Candidatus Ratteibacteria bacterium]|jgi:signal peptidase I
MKQKERSNKKKEILSWIYAIAFVLILRTFFVQAFKIPSTSMLPTLKVGDRLLANKVLYKIRDPKRGEVIIFKYPEDPKRDFVKRLIALQGEEVKIYSGKIFINNNELTSPENITSHYYYSEGEYGTTHPTLVPDRSIFVLGDNSFISKDSRFWGFVPEKYIVGKALFIYWPPWRMGIIQ